jgi:L-rhamnose 1-dehydrogenase
MSLASWRLLRGKTACITGGTTGIGRAITLEYLRQGANVVVNHLGLDADEKHRKSLLEEAEKLKAQGGSALPTGDIIELAGDIANPETGKELVAEAVRKWGALDIFVANAGIFKAADFLT